MNWLIIIFSIVIASLISELFWKEARKRGHKDLWETVRDKYFNKK
jgi:hypothetical protein